MNYAQKRSLKLPLFLIIGPAILLVLFIVLSIITDPGDAGSTGDAYVDYMNSRRDRAIFDGLPIQEKIAKRPLSFMMSITAIATVPCFIIGVIMVFDRRSARHDK